MAITEENGSGLNVSMPVQPMGGGYGGYGYPMAYPVMPYGNGGFGGGFDGFGGDWIILFLFAMMFGGGWGGMGGFGGWGGGFGNAFEFPWLLTGQQQISNNTNDGFRTAQLSDSVTSVRDAVSGLSTQLCQCCGDTQMALANGFAGVNLGIANGTAAIQNSLCNGFNGVQQSVSGAQNALAQQMYSNEIANLNRSFAEQTANTQGFNSVQSQLAQIGCDNRSATNDVKYTIATEACNTRAANTANTQAILDKLCQLELDNYKNQVDAKNDQIAQLRQEVLYARGQASQVDQTARILAGQAAEIDGVYNRLKNCPVNTVPVYGNQPIFTCPQNQYSACGCGCNNGFAN